MSDKNFNEPAFPTENSHQTGTNTFHYSGMTLRDWFAGQALERLLGGELLPFHETMPDAIAKQAYMIADAMLEHRKKVNDER